MTLHDEPTLLWPPVAGTEVDTLIGSLERQRRTFRWKCDGLDADGLRATTAASSMTLGGLLKHLSFIESLYFSLKLLGRDPGAPWNAVDWDDEPDWEFRSSAAEDSPEELYADVRRQRRPGPREPRRGARRRRTSTGPSRRRGTTGTPRASGG